MESLPKELFLTHVLPALSPIARKRSLEALSTVSKSMRQVAMSSENHHRVCLRSGKKDEFMERLDRIQRFGWCDVDELIIGCFSLSEADFWAVIEKCARVLGTSSIKRIVLKMPQFAVDLGALGRLFKGLENVDVSGAFVGPFVGPDSFFSVRKLAINIWQGHNNKSKVLVDVTGMRCSELIVKGNFVLVGKGDFERLELVWCDILGGGRGALNWVSNEHVRDIHTRVLYVGVVSGRRMLPKPGYSGLTARVFGVEADDVKVLPEYIRIVTHIALV